MPFGGIGQLKIKKFKAYEERLNAGTSQRKENLNNTVHLLVLIFIIQPITNLVGCRIL
jgi:hypothetical protein